MKSTHKWRWRTDHTLDCEHHMVVTGYSSFQWASVKVSFDRTSFMTRKLIASFLVQRSINRWHLSGHSESNVQSTDGVAKKEIHTAGTVSRVASLALSVTRSRACLAMNINADFCLCLVAALQHTHTHTRCVTTASWSLKLRGRTWPLDPRVHDGNGLLEVHEPGNEKGKKNVYIYAQIYRT